MVHTFPYYKQVTTAQGIGKLKLQETPESMLSFANTHAQNFKVCAQQAPPSFPMMLLSADIKDIALPEGGHSRHHPASPADLHATLGAGTAATYKVPSGRPR
ncbi:hypothetical protein ElyMa_005175700 [Elysia marginata]|uniref:Uncharacterized protein n=1 Tax=Elysia marginata TaxID=1093978 RepID=A0AAV4JQS4_9GAST|nr:hypothetical protein ElyMa_005175700 [Elysia marginata]